MADKSEQPLIEEPIDQLNASRHGWLPIATYVMPTPQQIWDGFPSVLVDNGERVGEAELKQDYSAWNYDEEEVPVSWGWTHKSTCSCCYTPMSKQPLWWQPMPQPALRSTSDAKGNDQ